MRPARALPYELNVHATGNGSTVTLTFLNTGSAGVVFQVRSGNPADNVRTYTVEPGKQLADTWNAASTYALSVYGPNGFVRFFKGSVGSGAALLDLVSRYDLREDSGSIELTVTNLGASAADVTVLDAYRGETRTRHVLPGHSLENEVVLEDFGGWYDLILTVAEDPTFNYRLAGHVETGQHFGSGSRGVVKLKE